jgi:hypothetical protein
MTRHIARLCCLLMLVAFFAVPSADAQISRQNPFRSFSVSGVNYGSMRWEQQQRKKVSKPTKTKSKAPRRTLFGRFRR